MKNITFAIVLSILFGQAAGSIDASVEIKAVKRGGIVNVTASKQGILVKNFNPFSPNALRSTFGCFYEPLVFVNEYSGEIQPWLAKSFQWSTDLKTLTFDLRKRVRWNDGRSFSVDDILFTLNKGKQNSALDRIGIWKKGLKAVKKSGHHSISFTFNEVNTTILAQMSSIYIVPKHIWEKVEDPLIWTGNHVPVGTGPFIFEKGSFFDQSYRLKRNPNYWQFGSDGKSLPYIDGIQFIGATGNTQAAMKIISGQVDWGTYFIANIEKTYTKRDPSHNHHWLCEGNLVYLNLNNGKPPFSNVNVRKAVASAINPKRITTIMNSGAVPAGQVGVKKGFLSLTQSLDKNHRISYDPEKSLSLLKREGYVLNKNGVMEKEGKALSFEFYVPAGWTDWITAVETISSQLKKVGIDARVSQAAWPSPFLDNIKRGNYDISIDYVNSGFSPYDQYERILPSRHFAPLGKEASGHSQVRYKNKTVDDAFIKYSQTPDKKNREKYMKVILSAVMKDTPLVPLFFNPSWFTYSTKRFKGWPNENNPYTVPRTREMAKMPVFLNLQPVK